MNGKRIQYELEEDALVIWRRGDACLDANLRAGKGLTLFLAVNNLRGPLGWVRELEAEATLANTMLGNLTRYFEQMCIREIQITVVQNMPTMSLNSYRLHALLMTHEADIRTINNLIRARQELLRSIAEKQNFINNYRAI
ncbi:hypothetical protein Tco_0967216 [Tanacetum coccineum]